MCLQAVLTSRTLSRKQARARTYERTYEELLTSGFMYLRFASRTGGLKEMNLNGEGKTQSPAVGGVLGVREGESDE